MGREVIFRVSGSDDETDDTGWWSTYSHSLKEYVTDDAFRVIEMDARWIANACFPTSTDDWPETRVRTGIVVGSVQSGKTASMLGVSALSLDAGIDVLVVLSGTRVALWLQTYERLLKQLDGSTVKHEHLRHDQRLLIPAPHGILSAEQRANPAAYLNSRRRAARKAITKGQQIILVVPKLDDHINAVGQFLEEVFRKASVASDRNLRMLVLDDEADDASILDSESMKTTPRLIQRIWTPRSGGSETCHSQLFATYLAYTATPQANYLQAGHNPLAPSEFHAALRTPYKSGSIEPRDSVTFTESNGVRSYYCGGEVFYALLRDDPNELCRARAFPEHTPDEEPEDHARRVRDTNLEMLGDALRAYFVSAAMRLLESGTRLSTGRASTKKALPPIHTMLYHPSAWVEDHFRAALDVVEWSTGARSDDQPELEHQSLEFKLDVEGLRTRLLNEEDEWRRWFDDFVDMKSRLSFKLPGASYPTVGAWDDVRAVLRDEVFPYATLSVINSDVRADHRPDFEPRKTENGEYLSPKHQLAILVSGSVLARGLTVEGLCISLFVRPASQPKADTQMQMQRWFGYRGSHLPYCRVFAFTDQLALFREYHENDVALKSEILSRMGQPGTTEQRQVPLILQGDSHLATGKVALTNRPLHPGPSPQIKLIEIDHAGKVENNVKILVDLLKKYEQKVVVDDAKNERGLILHKQTFSLKDIAELLDRFQYSNHDPDRSLPEYARWASLADHLRLEGPDRDLFRPPGVAPGRGEVDPVGCPYSIAAYLRFWDEALDHPNAPGMFPTDRPELPWRMLASRDYTHQQVRFWIGVRFGSAGTWARDDLPTGCSIERVRRKQARHGVLGALWGSRGRADGQLAWRDQLFDYFHHQMTPRPREIEGEPLWRPKGHPGLVLFHVVAGLDSDPDSVTVGLALPHGGPEHFAALRPASV